jgi:hypothetical protein
MLSPRKQLQKAFRFEVENQIADFRRNGSWVRGMQCPVTGEPMIKRLSEVDHYPTSFNEIVDTFLNSSMLFHWEVPVAFNAHLQRFEITDKFIRADWCNWHQHEAALRWVSKRGNKIQGDMGYRRRRAEQAARTARTLSKRKEEELIGNTPPATDVLSSTLEEGELVETKE